MKRTLWLLLSSLALAQSPITITGTITDSSNNVATAGYIQFSLSPLNQALAYEVPPSTVIAQTSKCLINSSGQPVNSVTGTAPCLVWPNDIILPSNTLYTVTIAPNNTVTRVYNNVLLASSTNPQSLATMTFIQPQPVVGTVIGGSPLVTMSAIPNVDKVWTLGDPQHRYACVYTSNTCAGENTVSFTGPCTSGQVLYYVGTPASAPFACETIAGTGTVTQVNTGAGLTGGPITTTGTISIPNGGVTNAMLANSSITITPGLGLTGGGAVSLGGTLNFALSSNRFTVSAGSGLTGGGSQTLGGAVTLSETLPITSVTTPLQVTSGVLSCSGCGASFYPPQKAILGSPVGMTAMTQTAILTEFVTFPSASGTYTADIRYGLYITSGANACLIQVVDLTNGIAFAISGQDSNGTGYAVFAGSEASSNTYSANAVIQFQLQAICNNGAGGLVGATVNSGLFNTLLTPQESSYLSVTPVSTSP
jgi:hypothetical protein